jgi:hypothetical protein
MRLMEDPDKRMSICGQASTVALNRPQYATGSQKHRDPRFAPYAFTEHGAIMAATILSSPRAVENGVFWCAG